MRGKSLVPNNWETVSLESVSNILDSRRIPVNTSERNKRIKGKKQDELYPYYGATGQVGWIDNYIFNGEYVLVGEDGAPFLDPFKEKAYIVSGKFWVNNHAHILESFSSNRYLKYFLDQVDFSKYVTGTTRLKLNQSNLRYIEIFYPPLPEQHRIVAKIEQLFSELDKGVADLKKARERLELYRQSLLKAAFEGRLTETWRKEHADELESADELLARIKAEREKRYQQQLDEWNQAVRKWEAQGKPGRKPTKPRKPKELPPLTKEELAELPKLPEGWRWVKLGQLTYLITKGASPKWQGIRYVEDEQQVLFITSENVRKNYVDLAKSKFVEDRFNEKQPNSILAKGDLLFNIVGASIGRAAVFSNDVKANVNQAVSVVRLVYRETSSYLSAYLNSKIASVLYMRNIVDVARANLSLADVSNIPVPVSSIKEASVIQSILESHLFTIDHLTRTIDNALSQAGLLRQAILKKAFSGKLVPQDPNDEPASELLKRIKEEREKATQARVRATSRSSQRSPQRRQGK